MSMIEEGEIYQIKSYFMGYYKNLIGRAYKVQEFSSDIIEQGVVVMKVFKYLDKAPDRIYRFEFIYYNEIYYIRKIDNKLDAVGEIL